MYNLGISCYYHDSAAALLKDGHVVSAVEEERFAYHRQKGIRYGETEQTSARSVSQRLGVSLPWDE